MRQTVELHKEFPYDKEIPYFMFGARMITSKLTSKAQTTIPRSVRRALGLNPGDQIVYEISDGRVIMTRAKASGDDPFLAFTEWQGEADSEAYGGL